MNSNIEYWIRIFIAVIFLWNILVLLASILYRRYKLADQTPFDKTKLVFDENWVSGWSRKNWFTRIGGAGKCLKVSVNNEEVYIRPFYPLQFGFIPEIFDLEHRIPKENVISIEQSSDLFGKETTEITYTNEVGQSRNFDLYLNNENEFTSLFSKTNSNAG